MGHSVRAGLLSTPAGLCSKDALPVAWCSRGTLTSILLEIQEERTWVI